MKSFFFEKKNLTLLLKIVSNQLFKNQLYTNRSM